MITKVLKSKIDKSVNFITPCGDGGFFESRFVQRSDDYVICYLSSHSGCNKGCRMCHLTATKQTMMTSATHDDFITQAKLVTKHFHAGLCPLGTPPRFIHFNWMARGEPLANETMIFDSRKLFNDLADLTGCIPKFNISTILPRNFKYSLEEIFDVVTPTLYYSLYSLNKSFREKWLPSAMEPEMALERLQDYQKSSKKIIKLHWAFIDGENDQSRDLIHMLRTVQKTGLAVEYNIVRYNPYSSEYGEESKELKLCEFIMNHFTGKPIKIIPRAGFDVQASCGQFVEKL